VQHVIVALSEDRIKVIFAVKPLKCQKSVREHWLLPSVDNTASAVVGTIVA